MFPPATTNIAEFHRPPPVDEEYLEDNESKDLEHTEENNVRNDASKEWEHDKPKRRRTVKRLPIDQSNAITLQTGDLARFSNNYLAYMQSLHNSKATEERCFKMPSFTRKSLYLAGTESLRQAN